MMTKSEVYQIIIHMLESDAPVRAVEDLAHDNGIVLTEIWNDDCIIGMMVDDITVYY